VPVQPAQAYISFDEAAGATCPGIATSKRVPAAGADRAIVSASVKNAAAGEDVLEWTTVNADFQHAAIKSILQSIVVAEDQLRIVEEIKPDRRGVEIFIADRSWIIHPCRVRWRVGRRSWISGIGCLPQYAIGIDRIDRCPPRRQHWRSYIVEGLK
jgi:hypothetical protein